MEDKELFAFCPRQEKLVLFLEKLRLFKVNGIGGGMHPITNELMCEIFYISISDRFLYPIQCFANLFIDEDGKRRIKELERIGDLRRAR